MPHIVLFNHAWMKRYRGLTDDDKPVNGGKWVMAEGKGGEVWNFRPERGVCYGYVSTPKNGPLKLARISGSKNDKESEYIDGATIVFTATPPSGGRVIVGWYRNARVWAKYLNIDFRTDRNDWPYLVEAKESDCLLLAPDDRVFPIPRARKDVWGMGQSNVRYLDENDAAPFRNQLIKYIDNPVNAKIITPQSGRGGRGSGKQPDPELRAKVEKAAISRVRKHYEGKGFSCRSVEKDNVGWDLEVSRGIQELRVEVKGCSGDQPAVEVTPNEYKQMMAATNRNRYRLAIVTKALKANMKLFIVSYDIATRKWRDQDDRPATIKIKKAARITL